MWDILTFKFILCEKFTTFLAESETESRLKCPASQHRVRIFLHQQSVDYRFSAGAGAAILTSWNRSRVKMDQLHNTTGSRYQTLVCVYSPWGQDNGHTRRQSTGNAGQLHPSHTRWDLISKVKIFL